VFVQPGNYSYYLEKKLEREQRLKEPKWIAPRETASKSATALAPVAAPARTRKLSFKEQRELDGMEAAIHTAEARAVEIEATLNDPAFFATRGREATQLINELDHTKAEIARLYARWAELDAIGK
jgi:ATP-binding cassette subfamily F protein uup